MRYFQMPAGQVHALRFGPDGRSLYFLSLEGGSYLGLLRRAFCIDVGSGQMTGTWAFKASETASFTPDFRAVYHSVSVTVAGGDFDLRRTDLATGHDRRIRDFNALGLYRQVLTSSGHILAAGGSDVPVHRLDVWRNVMLDLIPFGASCLAYSPDDRLLATGHRSDGVRTWRGKALEGQWPDPASELAWSRDGGLAWGLKGQVTSVRPGSGEPPRTWASAGGYLLALAFSADGTGLLTGTYCGLCAFHDTVAGRQRAAFNWDIGPVHSVAFSPDGLTCAAGGEDGRVVIWDVES